MYLKKSCRTHFICFHAQIPKKLRSNRAWIERHINDPFVKKSRREGYRARSVYKLTELDDTEHLFRPGMNVADLGSAPGSWTQIVRERLTDKTAN